MGAYMARRWHVSSFTYLFTMSDLHECSWSRLGSNQRPSACEMEAIAGEVRSRWSARTHLVGLDPLEVVV
jgi:hypothetical protein